jgi:hypothetical protein
MTELPWFEAWGAANVVGAVSNRAASAAIIAAALRNDVDFLAFVCMILPASGSSVRGFSGTNGLLRTMVFPV